MYRIGIDLGGINIAVGLVSEEGKLVAKNSTPTIYPGETADDVTDRMAKQALALIKENNLTEADIISIGIGCPGACDDENGLLVFTPNLPYRQYEIAKRFKKFTDLPVHIGNDANCAALGEALVGAGKGKKSVIMVTLGTGVGGGIILDKKIYYGFNGLAGEIGHVITHKDGRKCNCGRKGCLETYTSATALIRDTKEAMKLHPDSKMWQLCGNDESKVNGLTSFDAMRQGDVYATDVVNNYIAELGEGIANFINIFQPEMILLGGGVANEGENLLVPLRKYVFQQSFGADIAPRTEILKASLGNNAGIIGAAML